MMNSTIIGKTFKDYESAYKAVKNHEATNPKAKAYLYKVFAYDKKDITFNGKVAPNAVKIHKGYHVTFKC